MKIVLSVVLAMLIVGCSNEKGEQKSTQNSVQKVQAAQSVQKVQAAQVKETTPSKPAKVEAVVADTTKKIEKTVTKAAETTVAKVKAPEVKVDGAKLFIVCSSCHGAHAEKKALGKSQIIKGWKEEKIINALHGYKNGTYGGSMKAVMQGQAAKLSDADIKALAKYISQL